MSGVVLPGIREVLPEFFGDDVTTGGRQHPRSPSMFLAPTHQVLAGSLQTGSRTESSTPTQSRPKDVQHAGQLSGGSGGPLATQSHSVASASTCVDVIRPSGRRMAAPYKSPRPMGMSRRKYGCPLCPWRFERPSSLANHMNSHTGARPHLCAAPGCGRVFSTKSNMQRHARTHHNGDH